MRVWKDRERKLTGTTAMVVAIALIVQVFFVPQWRRYVRAREAAQKMELGLTRMQSNMVQRESIERRYEQLKGLIRESGSPSQELSRFARLLGELYQPLQLQTRSVRPLPDEDEGLFRKFTFMIEMEGPVIEVAKFLGAAAGAADPIRIERVQMNCRERPEVVTAQIIVTKVVTTSRPAGEGGRRGGKPMRPAVVRGG